MSIFYQQMMLVVKRNIFFLFLSLLSFLVACEPDTVCRQESNVVAGVSLQGVTTDSLGQVVSWTSADSITIQGVMNDSVLYDNSKSVGTVYLPLRPTQTITQYLFTFHAQTDTLYIQHTNDQRYISMACGCFIFHTIDSVWTSSEQIDAQIVNSTVENYKQENISLFYHL